MTPPIATVAPFSPARAAAARPAPLLADEADWAALPGRIAADPALARIAEATRARALRHLSEPVGAHVIEGHRRLTSARLFQGRVIDLATVARLDSDPRAAARAREELLAVAELPEWGPVHFLDVGEYALGVALGFSWLHDTLAPAERDRLARALIEKALRPSFEADAFCLRWLGGKSNWTQVCHAGLVAAALVVQDREPELAEKAIRRAIADQAGPAAAYAPDGAYAEGPMYWAYGTTFHVVLIGLVEKALGHDHGLADFPGFLASADYMAHMVGPGGRFYNYGDSRELVPPMPVLHWFAARRGEPGIAAVELSRLETGQCAASGELRQIYERLDALALWWRAPAAPTSERGLSRTLPLHWTGRGETPVAVRRSAWGDPRAAFFGIKGGCATSSHAHLDAGSFVYEIGGVRWALDPGFQNYHTLESAGIQMWDSSQGGQRWGVFRLGQESHNVLRFDQRLPDVNGAATLRDAGEDVEVDLSALHAPLLSCVTRRVRLPPGGALRIEDRWRTGAASVLARWQWLTEAEVEPTTDGARLRQNGQTLELRVLSPGACLWTLEVEDAAELLRPTDAPCPGLKRLTFCVSTAAGAEGRLEVEARLL